jgi:2-C-methyl-D-erythritol 4-phosphate cytidylyltransferase
MSTSSTGRTAVLVPAAGRGERLGPGAPKALRPLGGIPMLVHAVRALAASRIVDLVVVAAPEDSAESVASMLAEQSFLAEVVVVTGGDTRQDSVARALLTLPDDVDVVLVHDAARPLVPVEVVTAVVAAVRSGHPAVVPGLPVVDTIKRVDAEGWVVSTPERAGLRIAQTPQGFRRDILVRAHELGGSAATDDAVLVERLGERVLVIDGDPLAAKITTRDDLRAAERLLAGD